MVWLSFSGKNGVWFFVIMIIWQINLFLCIEERSWAEVKIYLVALSLTETKLCTGLNAIVVSSRMPEIIILLYFVMHVIKQLISLIMIYHLIIFYPYTHLTRARLCALSAKTTDIVSPVVFYDDYWCWTKAMPIVKTLGAHRYALVNYIFFYHICVCIYIRNFL